MILSVFIQGTSITRLKCVKLLWRGEAMIKILSGSKQTGKPRFKYHLQNVFSEVLLGEFTWVRGENRQEGSVYKLHNAFLGHFLHPSCPPCTVFEAQIPILKHIQTKSPSALLNSPPPLE